MAFVNCIQDDAERFATVGRKTMDILDEFFVKAYEILGKYTWDGDKK